MPEITKNSYLEYLINLEITILDNQIEKLIPHDPRHGCLVTNLSRLPTHKLDFGNDTPDFIVPLTIEKNSAAILADQNNFCLRLVY